MRIARDIRDAVGRGELSATDVCREAVANASRLNPRLNAFLLVNESSVLEEAAAVDARVRRGERPLLAGVPVAIKDNLCTRGVPTTAGSRILEGFIPPYDATVVARLRQAGAVILGKTNCDEFAMGSSTEHSAFGPARNPWAPDRTPGGSSGGSAAAVAARIAPLSLGSDTGGSVRQPAACCGVLGLKPTWGRVSRYGLIAFASSLDQVGPLACTAADAAILLSAIAGPDAADATCSTRPAPDYLAACTGEVRGLRIGVPRNLLESGLHPEIERALEEALAVLRERGAEVVDVTLPHAHYGIPAYYLVATAEASANLARFDGVRYGFRAPGVATLSEMYDETRGRGFGAEVKRRIMLGTYALSTGYYDAYYLKAQQVRRLIRQDFEEAFTRADVLALPTTPEAAFRLGERLDDPLQMYLADVFTVGAPLAGLPAISIPCGFTAAREPLATTRRDPAVPASPDASLPIGLQFIGRMFDEETLLRAADAYERVTDWWRAEPPMAAGR